MRFQGAGPVWLVAALLTVVDGSFQAFPLTRYRSAPVPGGGPEGVRRFTHEEAHHFEDGAALRLRWVVDADPEAILSVDTEYRHGVRILACRKDGLRLHVPATHKLAIQRWRHIVASDGLHGCSHLPTGQHLYHRVIAVQHPETASAKGGGVDVAFVTKELASPSHVFPKIDLSLSLKPADVEPTRRLQPQNFDTAARDRYSSDGLPPSREDSISDAVKAEFSGIEDTSYSNSFEPTTQEVNSILNLGANSQTSPPRLSNVAWNWDYDKNATHNPEFELEFPGGEGWLRLYKPYLKAHIGMIVNFTSDGTSLFGQPEEPRVNMRGEFDGVADMNLDIATSVNFNNDSVMSPEDAVAEELKVFNFSMIGAESMDLPPLKLYLGGTPLQLDPGFNCHLSAYHVGKMRGSLRVGLKSKLNVKAVVTFDSQNGLQTNLSAEATDVKLTPPTWMVFTRHFELGVMLEPELSLKGGLGPLRDMRIGMNLKPYVNVSIRQKGEKAVDASGLIDQASEQLEDSGEAEQQKDSVLSVSVSSISLTDALSDVLGHDHTSLQASLAFKRDGHTFSIPLRVRSESSAVVVELVGTASHELQLRIGELEASQEIVDSQLTLSIGGNIVGQGVVPPGSLLSSALENTRLHFVLYDANDQALIVGTGELAVGFGKETRRLQDVKWGVARKDHHLSWGGTGGDSSTNDFANHMSIMSDKCDEKPLLYSIGVGVLEKEDVANVFMPNVLPGVMPEMRDDKTITSDWSSGYQPIFHKTMSNSLSKLLPAAVCEGGLCRGELPGCKPHMVAPVKIPRISFKLSRQFRIEDFMTPETRRSFAYGLAVLPESLTLGEDAIDILEYEVNQEMKHEQKKETAELETNRRLDASETDTIVVRVTQPMSYRIDHQLIEKLIGMGAFNLLSDGREDTHGPIRITSFKLLDPTPTTSRPSHGGFGRSPAIAGALIGIAAFAGVVALYAPGILQQRHHRADKATYTAVHNVVAGEIA